MVKSNGAGRSWKWPLVCITGIAFALAGRAAAQQPAFPAEWRKSNGG